MDPQSRQPEPQDLQIINYIHGAGRLFGHPYHYLLFSGGAGGRGGQGLNEGIGGSGGAGEGPTINYHTKAKHWTMINMSVPPGLHQYKMY